MSQVKIIKASNGFDLYDGISQVPKDGVFLRSEMETGVTNYWGGQPERRFIAPFWKVKKLTESSNLGEVAIKLTNYNDPGKIDGEWVKFDRNAAVGGGSSLANRNQDIIYFAFDSNLIGQLEDGFRLIAPPPPPRDQDRVIAARIGKVDDEIVVYFILGEVKLHFRFNNSGGGSAACGVKFPTDR